MKSGERKARGGVIVNFFMRRRKPYLPRLCIAPAKRWKVIKLFESVVVFQRGCKKGNGAPHAFKVGLADELSGCRDKTR
jgi:hypothetical protein